MAPTRRSVGGSGRLMVAIEDGRATRSKSVAALRCIAEQHQLRKAMAEWLSHFHEHDKLDTAMRSIIAMVGASRMAHAMILDLDEVPSKSWEISWILVLLRLTKSGIECVILEGSSLFR